MLNSAISQAISIGFYKKYYGHIIIKGLACLILFLPLSCSLPFTNPNYEIIVCRVFPNSPAERAGLKIGDSILRVNGEAVSIKKIKGTLAGIPSGETSNFTIQREEQEISLGLVADTRRYYRFGFLFKSRDVDLAKTIKVKIWPNEVNPDIKTFSIPFQVLSMMNKNHRSPEMKVLFHIKELLISKGYLFNASYQKSDFVAKAEFRYPKINDDRKRKKTFDALRIIFIDNNSQIPFLKISGTLDKEKVEFYGAKEYVFSMLDAMIDDFPPYKKKDELAESFAISNKD